MQQGGGGRHAPPHLARLNTSLGLGGGPAPMFSPAMLQTPVAPFNAPFIPNAPKRPPGSTHAQHRGSVQLGIVPGTPGLPVMTPGLGGQGHFPRPSMLGGGSFTFAEPGQQPANWQQKRKNRQVSIGGPPKAVLGGPQAAQRRMSVSPMTLTEEDKEKMRKEEELAKIRKRTVVKLPKETPELDKPEERQPWARWPMPLPLPDEPIRELTEDEIITQEVFPGEVWKYSVPGSIDVFLPGKDSWQKLKNLAVEQKLDKLGITAGSGSTTTTNPWNHGRAASISSPADPALLLSKLRKLQTAQQMDVSTDAGSSLASSPAPSSMFSFGHGHSQSLAANPFGPHAILGHDGLPPFIYAPHARAPVSLTTDRLTPDSTHSSLAPPVSAVGNRPTSKPDFMRGFGIDLEEVEEVDETGHSRNNSTNLLETEKWVKAHSRTQSKRNNNVEEGDEQQETEKLPSWALSHNRINSTLPDDEDAPQSKEPRSPYLHPEDGLQRTTSSETGSDLPPLPNVFTNASAALSHPPQHEAPIHSRHVSKLSAALSLRSVGGVSAELEESRKALVSQREAEDANGEADMSLDVAEPLEEWTGSDDEDNESLGEYSNPSDEERARQDRVERRRLRSSSIAAETAPRRLPPFPRPPDNTLNFSLPFDRSKRQIGDNEDWRSNPSDDEGAAPTRDFLGVALGGTGGLAMSEFNFHSRQNSNNTHRSVHDPANAHSRMNSNNSDVQQANSGHYARPSFAAPMPALNPFAKPFKFGGLAQESVETPAWFKDRFNPGPPPPTVSVQPPIGTGHARVPSLGKPLNIAAPEFKPTFGGGSSVNTPTASSFNPAAPSFTPGAFNPAASVFNPSAPAFNPSAPVFKPSGGFNLQAPEFKPSFTFRPPASAPTMPSAPPPLVVLSNSQVESGIEQQHREKRMRTSADFAEEETEDEANGESQDGDVTPLATGKENLGGFKFPPPAPAAPALSPLKVRDSLSVDDSGIGVTEPFSLSSFQKNSLSSMPVVPKTPTDPEHDTQDEMDVDKENVSPVAVPKRGGGRQSLTMSMAMQLADDEDEDDDEASNSGSDVPDSADDHVPLAKLFPNHQVTQSLLDGGYIPPPFASTAPSTSSGLPKRRAPIPLDFKQPERKSTMPAALFKSLVNGSNSAGPAGAGVGIGPGRSSPNRGGVPATAVESSTRRNVRSRLSSRDVFELEHARNPSLDDLNVPGISLSHKASQSRLARSRDRERSATVDEDDEEDVFTAAAAQGHVKRRSSLPDGIGNGTHRPIITPPEMDDANAYDSEISPSEEEFIGEGVGNGLAAKLAVQQMERRLDQMGEFEKRLENLFDEKIAKVLMMAGRATLEPSTEERITEVLSLFRTQLQESAAKGLAGGLEDAQADARAEIDFEMIRDMVREGHEEGRDLVQSELNALIQRLAEVQVAAAAASSGQSQDFAPLIEQLNAHTLNTVETAIAKSVQSLHELTHHSAARTQETIIENITAALDPIVQYARADPVDYDLLTNKLSNAVRPTLADVLDLASDKRETADLIVKQILPLLPKPAPSPTPTPRPQAPAFDSEELSQRITRDVRQVVGALDPFELKEQVADLVIERLDSRLAVRDKSLLNPDALSAKVLNNVTVLLEPIWGQFAALKSTHEDMANQQGEVSATQNQLVNLVTALPAQVQLALDELKTIQTSTAASVTAAANAAANASAGGPVVPLKDPEMDASVTHIRAAVDTLIGGQKTLSTHTDSILSVHHELLDKLNNIPELLSQSNQLLQNAHAELDLSREAHRREADDLSRSNTQLQVDLAKARGAHGQVRVEKDGLLEKVKILESDREMMRAQIKSLEDRSSGRSEEMESLETHNKELQDALAQALVRLQTSDVTTQANADRIAELEKANRELLHEKNAFKSKVDSAELQMSFAIRDKENAVQSLTTLQRQHDALVTQRDHWDTLAETKEQVTLLKDLITQTENDTIQELQRFKEQALIAETEHTALQRRFKEQETKISNSEKVAFTARQNLSAANQRAADWEKRAKEYQSELDSTQSKLAQLELTHSTLDAEYSHARIALDSKSDDLDRFEDRDRRQKEQISNLEDKIRTLQTSLANKQTAPRHSSSYTNGTASRAPARPDSRSSTVYIESRSATPTGQSPKPSVWDSMHAPSNNRDSGYSSVSTRSSYVAAPVPSRYPSNLGVGSKTKRPLPPRAESSFSIRPVSPAMSVATVDDDGWWS